MAKKTIIYPGHFNPVTNGHADLVERALGIFDEVVIAIGTSPDKQPSTDLKKRLDLCREVFRDDSRVRIESFSKLLVDYAQDMGTRFVLRGIRTAQDFEYEFQMMGMNRALFPELEYVFLPPSPSVAHISSTRVREIAQFGGDIRQFVHPAVVAALSKK